MATAPHENRELELVMAGEKPLAVLEPEKDPDQYVEVFRTVGVVILPIPADLADCRGEIAFTRLENFHLLEEYLETLANGAMGDLPGYQRKIGRLFGYSEADIEEFIKQPVECHCRKCSGGYFDLKH